VEAESESEGIFRWSQSRSRKESLGGVGVGRNFRWRRSRKESLGGVGVGVGKNVPTPTPSSV
jgi:hypothetical protein